MVIKFLILSNVVNLIMFIISFGWKNIREKKLEQSKIILIIWYLILYNFCMYSIGKYKINVMLFLEIIITLSSYIVIKKVRKNVKNENEKDKLNLVESLIILKGLIIYLNYIWV